MSTDSGSTSNTKSKVIVELPDDFQDRVFKAIAVQRPAATAFIKELRRKRPDATPGEIMKVIEQRYIATTTLASSAAGASATIPVVGIPAAIGLGVADLLFFYEATALFAICMAELRGIPIDDPERAKAVVLGAVLGEKRSSKVTEMVLAALPAGVAVTGARDAAQAAAAKANIPWGDLLAQQLPDSALVPVTMVLAKQAIAQGSTLALIKIPTKAIPVIGAVAGGAASYYFGSGVVKSCREGFSPPADTWPVWLEPSVADPAGDASADASRAVVAMRAASGTVKGAGKAAKDAGMTVGVAIGGAATKTKDAAVGAYGRVASAVKREGSGRDRRGGSEDM